jgi:hypothetical protein
MIATITPTRGDRPELFNFCRQQIERQTVQPSTKYFMGAQPVDRQPDLTKRIREGYESAKRFGDIDWIIIMEDDDSYRTDHIERYSRFMDRYDFIGDQNSLYYNIREQQVFRKWRGRDKRTWLRDARRKRSYHESKTCRPDRGFSKERYKSAEF